jgi:hypothetical protein
MRPQFVGSMNVKLGHQFKEGLDGEFYAHLSFYSKKASLAQKVVASSPSNQLALQLVECCAFHKKCPLLS